MTSYFFGEISGHPVGSWYEKRVAVKDAGVHQVTVQGIAGNKNVGCVSIVLNGGYDTDEDHGHEIFYTGAGGRDPGTRKHVADQSLAKPDNAALVRSVETGLPIRIVRGWKGDKNHSPSLGYRYDGLYKAIAYYPQVPDDGLIRWMFHLVQLDGDEAREYSPEENLRANLHAFTQQGLGSPLAHNAGDWRSGGGPDVFEGPGVAIDPSWGSSSPMVRQTVSVRVVRDTKVALAVKQMYGHRCQVCGARVPTRDGWYSEGAHIRPLGRPHHGPDLVSNILCLCPNHHASFDKGGIYLDDSYEVIESGGRPLGLLRLKDSHCLDLNHIRYHRSHHGYVLENV